MIESQVCSMSDEKDFDFEDTKSTILDYFILFKRTQLAIIIILVMSAILYFSFHQILVNAAEIFRDLGHAYTIPPSFLAFVNPLDAVFMYSLIGFVVTPGIIVAISWLFWKTIVKGRKLQKHLINFQSNLIKRSYLTNFELVEPEIIIQGGDPKLEKFVNHLSLVFTDINKKNKKRLKKRKTVEQFFPYKRKRVNLGFAKNYFFVTNTGLTLYVTQYFEKTITVEDIQKTIKFLRKEKMLDTITGAKIFETLPSIRFIILGEKLDSSFDDENIIQTMNELKRKIKVDIILETEYGYSTVWID
jgi:hypothetical protein